MEKQHSISRVLSHHVSKSYSDIAKTTHLPIQNSRLDKMLKKLQQWKVVILNKQKIKEEHELMQSQYNMLLLHKAHSSELLKEKSMLLIVIHYAERSASTKR